MKLSVLFENISYERLQGGDPEIREITYDSRKAVAGTLFVCLPGARADGHDFAAAAYEKGCRAFLCQYPVCLPADAVVAVTCDTRSALAQIAATFYGDPGRKLKIIGLTGTKGKTTTALLIQQVLEKNGISCGYIGSNGVAIGQDRWDTPNTTPESLLMQKYFSWMVERNVTHAVIEVSSQALEHNRVQGISFETVVFTNLSEDHVGPGEHDSFESYRAAKRKLFTDYPGKHIVYNLDEPEAAFMLEGTKAPRLSFSQKDPGADFYAENLSLYRQEDALGITFTCVNEGQKLPVTVRTPGLFSVYNALAAMAVCSLCGVSVQDSAKALQSANVQGRFQVVPGKPGCTFIVDYAHNGLSLRSALQVLRSYEPNRLICLFGSVGGRTQGRRRELAQEASGLADLCILTSDNPDFEAPEAILEEILSHYDKNTPYLLEPDREKAIFLAVDQCRKGDIVLFAGKGHETYQLIRGQKQPFVEAEIIARACQADPKKEETICI